MTVLTRTRWGRAAGIVGLAALGLLVAVFFIVAEMAKELVFTGAFLLGLIALVLAAVARLRARHEKLGLRPRTRLGWWAVGLAGAGVLLILIGPMAMAFLRSPGEEPFFVMASPTILSFGAMLAGGIAGAIAWFRRPENSLLVLLPLAPALFALYFLIGEFVFPH